MPAVQRVFNGAYGDKIRSGLGLSSTVQYPIQAWTDLQRRGDLFSRGEKHKTGWCKRNGGGEGTAGPSSIETALKKVAGMEWWNEASLSPRYCSSSQVAPDIQQLLHAQFKTRSCIFAITLEVTSPATANRTTEKRWRKVCSDVQHFTWMARS